MRRIKATLALPVMTLCLVAALLAACANGVEVRARGEMEMGVGVGGH